MLLFDINDFMQYISISFRSFEIYYNTYFYILFLYRMFLRQSQNLHSKRQNILLFYHLKIIAGKIYKIKKTWRSLIGFFNYYNYNRFHVDVPNYHGYLEIMILQYFFILFIYL